MTTAEEDAIVSEVERLYEGAGPPPRTSLLVGDRIRLGGLFIECLRCGTRQPQSRTRQSPSARQQWVRMHLACE